MKTGKEIKTNRHKNYNVIFGSVNNKKPKAIYINLSAWVEPTEDSEFNYSRSIRDLNKKIRQSLFGHINSHYETMFKNDKTIVDLDIRESGIKLGKRSFMNCEITLFLSNEIPLTSEVMIDGLVLISDTLIKTVFDSNKTFNFHKKKK